MLFGDIQKLIDELVKNRRSQVQKGRPEKGQKVRVEPSDSNLVGLLAHKFANWAPLDSKMEQERLHSEPKNCKGRPHRPQIEHNMEPF